MSKRVTSSARKHRKTQESVGTILGKEIYTIWVTLYLWAVGVIMPLYIYDHYYEMAFYKWKIFFYATLALLGVGLVWFIIQLVMSSKAQENSEKPKRVLKVRDILQYISHPDAWAVMYGISVLISMSTCGHAKAAWMGTDSWYMGVLAQLLFVGVYLVFSHFGAPAKDVIWLNMAASAICFLIGIAQRYGWDFLHLYYGMADEVIRDYLSTIGNRTWYSGYISVVFPIGVYLLWRGGKKKVTWLAGIYSVLAFSAIVTNNSDSIYLALAVVLFALFLMSLGSMRKMQRWISILFLWFAACSAMSLLRVIFPHRLRELRGVSKICLDMRFALVGMVITVAVAVLLWYLCEKKGLQEEWAPKTRKRWRTGCLAAVFSVLGLLVVVIAMNTAGLLEQWFGITINSSYFMFDDNWGDYRGFNWKMTWRMFTELPLLQKLFGIGPDCYAFYAYSNPVYAEELTGFFGQNMVANAHNEWLNALLCNGIVGSLLYIGLFISVMVKCFTKDESERMHPLAPMVGLCVLGYITHNVFCYQQICATGPIFVLMGVAIHSVRTGGKGNYEL